MKKFLLAFVGLFVCVMLVGCSGQNGNISAGINSKMDKLEATINSIKYASESDFTVSADGSKIAQVSAFNNPAYYNPGYYPNINSYGNYYGGMYGGYPMYPYGYNNFGYGHNHFNGVNQNFGGINNRIGGFWGSNIDTYRINSVTKNGKTATVINTFKDGKKVDTIKRTSEANPILYNLSASYHACKSGSMHTNRLKNAVLQHISNIRGLSNKIKNGNIKLSKEQKHTIEDHLDSVLKHASKLNMAKGEYNTELANVRASKNSYNKTPTMLNSKYIKLANCIEGRNSQLQAILNTLIGLENCIDCESCPSCQSSCTNCTNCTNCINCENCTDCVNCINCKDCHNLANARDCIGNNCQNSNNQSNNNNNQNTENDNQNQNQIIQKPSTAEIEINDKTSDNKFQLDPEFAQGEAEQVSNQTDDVIRDNLLKPFPSEMHPKHRNENIIENGDAENPEFLTHRQTSDQNSNITQTIPNRTKDIIRTDYPEHEPMPIPEVSIDRSQGENNSNFTVEQNNSISNENIHENNKSLTA